MDPCTKWSGILMIHMKNFMWEKPPCSGFTAHSNFHQQHVNTLSQCFDNFNLFDQYSYSKLSIT